MKLPALFHSVVPMHAAGAAVCLIVTALWFLLGMQPLWGSHQAARQQEAYLQTLRAQADQLQMRLRDTQDRNVRTREALAEGSVRLQPASRVNRRLSELTLLATRCQLKVDEIQPGRSHSVIRHEVVPIQMRGSGSYLACMKFLRSLRQSFPDIGTSLIDLKGAPGAPDTSSRFEFTLEWFTAPTVVSK